MLNRFKYTRYITCSTKIKHGFSIARLKDSHGFHCVHESKMGKELDDRFSSRHKSRFSRIITNSQVLWMKASSLWLLVLVLHMTLKVLMLQTLRPEHSIVSTIWHSGSIVRVRIPALDLASSSLDHISRFTIFQRRRSGKDLRVPQFEVKFTCRAGCFCACGSMIALCLSTSFVLFLCVYTHGELGSIQEFVSGYSTRVWKR